MNRFNSNVVVEINNRIAELDRQEFDSNGRFFIIRRQRTVESNRKGKSTAGTKKKTVRQLASRRNSVSEKYGKSIWTHINA